MERRAVDATIGFIRIIKLIMAYHFDSSGNFD
jgi:hypothetical protein